MRLGTARLPQAVAVRQQADLATQREAEVRQQLETYADKFEQIQEAINKSNEVFGAFKREMDSVRARSQAATAADAGGLMRRVTSGPSTDDEKAAQDGARERHPQGQVRLDGQGHPRPSRRGAGGGLHDR